MQLEVVPNRRPVGQPTAREKEMLQLVADDMTGEEIAQAAHLSVVTVKRHVANAMKTLEVHSRAAAVAEGFRQGWLD
jgi:DNA-binding NarL/FixJ family response regulator